MSSLRNLGINSAAVLAAAVFLVGARVSLGAPVASVSINQESYEWDNDTDNFSPNGQVVANSATASYLNIADSSGNWLVQNLYVPAGGSTEEDFALPGAVDGTPDTTPFSVTQTFSASPVSSFAYNASLATTYNSVGQVVLDDEGADNGGGDDDPAGGFKPNAPAGNSVVFNGGMTATVVYRTGVPNVQAADNQCVPASLANGLQWLKTNQGLNVIQANVTGLKGDNSLVGVMDTETLRAVTSRTSGAGVTAASQVSGLLAYLDDYNITNVLVKHEGYASAANITVTSSGRTRSSQAVATTVDFNFILNELNAGAAVQAWETWATGAHAVEVTGAGYVLGVPWITFTSDLLQTPKDATDSAGTTGVNFSFLGNTDAFGRLHYINEGGQPALTFAVAEEVGPVPEPASLGVLAAGSLMLLRRRRRA